MAIYKIAEFAKLTGKKPKDLHVYAGRGKIIKNEDKMIDTTDPLNMAFLEEYQVAVQTVVEESKVSRNLPSKKSKVNKATETTTESRHSKALHAKTELEVELKRKQLEEKEIELQKKRGELIDRQSTVNIVGDYSKTFKKELDTNIQTFIQDICARHDISSGKAGEYKNKVAELINKSNTKAIESLKSEFE